MGLIYLITFHSFTEHWHLYALQYCVPNYSVVSLSAQQSFHLSFCLVLPVRPVKCQLVCLPVCPLCPIVFLCFFVSSFCLSGLLFVSVSTGLFVCLRTCMSLTYLFFCLICLSGIQCWSEARLLSFTVNCSADWKGHFSNGAALPLIFCLSSGVRLIYHASSPADIQIHFDWRLDLNDSHHYQHHYQHR